MQTDLFQIDATAPPEHPPRSSAEGLAMLRNLLAERFKLAMHRETRNRPAYVLVTNRRDHRLGDGLHPTSTDCTRWIESGRRGATSDMLTALREQLGLALQSIKQDTEVLVVDHIDRPSEN